MPTLGKKITLGDLELKQTLPMVVFFPGADANGKALLKQALGVMFL